MKKFDGEGEGVKKNGGGAREKLYKKGSRLHWNFILLVAGKTEW